MCGICGFAGKGDIEDLERMNAALEHRGPDDKGVWYDRIKGVYLGHKRLSIIDLEGGSQPMWSDDGLLCVVFNGEIYNHKELREELEKNGHSFKSHHSDTEVLIYGYRQWGHEMPQRLNGMWAFAIYDKEKNLLFLSRDRFGKKPLFYSLQNGTFAFASELKALAGHRGIAADISFKGLQKYFAYGFIPAPLSLYEKVHKLPGGYNLCFDISSQHCESSRYWEFVLEPFDDIPKNPEEEWGEIIRELLFNAVRRRLMSDVPLGIFLSGGIDSSSIAACAARISGSEKIKSFSIGFEDQSFDESEYSTYVASLLGTEHNLTVLSLKKARTLMNEIALKLDEPVGDSSLLPTFLLCRETRRHVTVALGGDGGDELFAGYDPFRALCLASFYKRLIPKPIHEGIMMIISLIPVSHRNFSLDFKLKRTLNGLSYSERFWNPVWLGPLTPHELAEFFHEPMDPEDVFSEAVEQWETCKQDNMVDKTLQFYTKLYLQDDILVKVDRASMMNSLELRAPYLDIDLVDFVRKIPSRYKFRNGTTKYILKKAFEPVLPHNILYRSKKGFGIPVGRWFKDGLLNFNHQKVGVKLNPAFLEDRIEEHRRGKADHRLFLWNYWLLNSFNNLPPMNR
jgi:asparagine synthase (glutamine-hydrolysing)